jgi:hypothetical protein
MPCLTQPSLTQTQRSAQREALARLQRAIAAGSVTAVIGRAGGVAFAGWADADRAGVSDLCAYRALSNTPELRRAIARAEVIAGHKLDARTVAAGVHSHDGGRTWGRH